MNTMKKCPTCGISYDGDLCPQCVAVFAAKQTAPTVPPSQQESPLKPGDMFHGFEIMELIGRGGMGMVFKARQPTLDRIVALKILPQAMSNDPDFQSRFSREAKALASLSHANILALYDFGFEKGLFFFSMEFVDGLNLRQLQRERKLTPEEAIKIIPKLCDALEYAHSEGIVHRDIKPENILIDKKGRVKIADFGLAKITGQDVAVQLTQTNMVMGTPHYMAPEQIENPKSVDHRADIYSMGVVFYEMLTGELPIGRFEVPSKRVQVDVRLDEVVLKALEKDPSRRYQKASEVRDAVTAVTSVSKSDSYAMTMMTPQPARKPSKIWIPATIAALLCVALVVIFTKRPHEPKQPIQPETPNTTASVAPPPKRVSLDKFHFSSNETPAGRTTLTIDPKRPPAWPRNPFPAKSSEERAQFVKSLDELDVTNVAQDDIVEGYLCVWWGLHLVAIESPIAERIERDVRAPDRADSPAKVRAWQVHIWTWRQGNTLCWIKAGQTSRDAFDEIVKKVQQSLGIPVEEAELPARSFRLDKGDLPDQHVFAEAWGGDVKLPIDGDTEQDKRAVLARFRNLHDIPLSSVKSVYCTGAERRSADAGIFVTAIEFNDRAKCDSLEAALRATPNWQEARKMEVLRRGRTLCVLTLHTSDFGPFEKLAIRMRPWFGYEDVTFHTILPREFELPGGAKYEKTFTDARAVIDELGLDGIRASDLVHAFYGKIKGGGAILLLELKEQRVAWELESELKKRFEDKTKGTAMHKDGWVCMVEAGDEGDLLTLENRMREKFGWDAKTR